MVLTFFSHHQRKEDEKKENFQQKNLQVQNEYHLKTSILKNKNKIDFSKILVLMILNSYDVEFWHFS
jgi:hypothetical protein